MATPISEQKVVYEHPTHGKLECMLGDIDAYLYQWEQGYVQKDVGKGLASKLGWPEDAVSDNDMMSFRMLTNKIKTETAEKYQNEILGKVQAGQISDPIPPLGADRLLRGKSVLDIPQRFVSKEKAVSVPVNSGFLGMSEEQYSVFLVDIASMAVALLRLNPPVLEWAVGHLLRAGMNRDELDRLLSTNRR